MAVEVKNNPEAKEARLPPGHREKLEQAQIKFIRRKRLREGDHE